jgi:hypothetical protein
MSQISDVTGAGGHTFGLSFNYSVWTPGTSVTLANVPWNQDYRDIVDYTPAQLDTWINNQVSGQSAQTIDKLTFAKPNEPVRLNLPIAYVQQYNYLRAKNAAQPLSLSDQPTSYYYFITDVRYLAPNTTEVVLQLDVWSTYHSSLQFGQCYVDRGHIGIANESAFDDNGRSYLTIPEGIDIGNEYIISHEYKETLGQTNLNADGTDSRYRVVIASMTDLEADPGTITSPSLKTATGSRWENLPNGCNLYVCSSASMLNFVLELLTNSPWVTQGIVSVTAIPTMPESAFSSGGTPITTIGGGAFDAGSGEWMYKLIAGINPVTTYDMRPSWRGDILNNLGRYANLKKFATSPYSMVEVTTYTGAPLMLKPECLPGNDMNISVRNHIVPPAPRTVIYPQSYNGNAGQTDDDGGEFLDAATGMFDFPTFSVVNNGAMSMMAANAHRIQYGYTNADWSQQKALRGNQVAYGQAGQRLNQLGADTSVNMRQIQSQRNMANMVSTMHMGQGIINGVVGGLSSAAMGNPIGGLASAASGTINAGMTNTINQVGNDESANIATAAGMGHYQNAAQTAGYVMDTNKAYADYAAKGDYANEIAGINARVQDIQLTQPSTSGQIGGDAHLLATYNWGIWVKIKTLQPAAMAVIGEYWLRYGYAVSRFVQPPANLMCMSKFTYWKMKETYLVGQLPEAHKQAIRGILEKGVTVWADPSYIGFTDPADNAPLTGITL